MQRVREVRGLVRNKTRTDTEPRAKDTVGDGTRPGELRQVESEVGTRGAAKVLLVQDLLYGEGRERHSLDSTECEHI